MRTRAERRPAHLVLLLWLTALVTALTWAWAAPATAHDVLVGSDPAEGTTLDVPPSSVVLTFSADQMELGHAFQVTDPDGVDHVAGEAVVDGRELTQELDGLGPAGTWTVAWRSVSSDGHPISGTFTFDVTAAAEPEGTAAEESPEGVDAAAEDAADPEEPATVDREERATQSPEASDDADDEDATADEQGTGSPSPGLIAGIAVGAVAAAVLVLVALRRRVARDQEDA